MIKFKKYLFPVVTGIICIALFLFNAWLAWPGYIHVDTPHSLLLAKDNWHPIIVVYLLQFFYWLLGTHVYYMLLFNLVPLYLGLFVFVLAFYQKFRTKWTFLFLFPALIGNIFFRLCRLVPQRHGDKDGQQGEADGNQRQKRAAP